MAASLKGADRNRMERAGGLGQGGEAAFRVPAAFLIEHFAEKQYISAKDFYI